MKASEKITVSVEKIIYQSQQSQWLVLLAKLDDKTIVACGKTLDVAIGEVLEMFGAWVEHKKYGRQFRFESAFKSLPLSPKAIHKYLASGAFRGVGTVTAGKIVEAFGAETLAVLEKEPQRLFKIRKIPRKTLINLVAKWHEGKQERETIVSLHSLGIPPHVAQKIFSLYEQESLAVVQDDPYALVQQVRGLGFLTADRIGRELGIKETSPRRLRSAIVHFLREAERRGHCFLTAQQLRGVLAENLSLSLQTCEDSMVAALQLAEKAKEIVSEHWQEGKVAHYRRATYEAEVRAAQQVQCMLATPVPEREAVQRWLQDIPDQTGLTAEQQRAASHAFLYRLSILTGGAGTGKTSTVRRIIKLAAMRDWRYALCAPTGRAACRLGELTGEEAKTIHRLLEWQPQREVFARNAERKLDENMQLLIVDEVSMLDLRLAAALLASLHPNIHLVLVGDVNQLPAVGAGNFMRDMLRSSAPKISLTNIFRQERASQIIHNAHQLLQGAVSGYIHGRDFVFLAEDDPDKILSLLLEQQQAHREAQVLSPMYRGKLGIDNLNSKIKAHLRGDEQVQDCIQVDDKVIQMTNNYTLNVYNGDIGWVLSVVKDSVVVDFSGKQVTYSREETKELQLAYAISIHKAQGSEFPVVILPIVRQHLIMLNKNLCYTAVTRAREKLVAIGSAEVFKSSARRNYDYRRQTRLAARVS